jgi:hypothetical protein
LDVWFSAGRTGGDGHADETVTHCHSGSDLAGSNLGTPCWRARNGGIRQPCPADEDGPTGGCIRDELASIIERFKSHPPKRGELSA